MHCVDLDESVPTHIFLQNLASIQPRTSPFKFARSPRTDPPGLYKDQFLDERMANKSIPDSEKMIQKEITRGAITLANRTARELEKRNYRFDRRLSKKASKYEKKMKYKIEQFNTSAAWMLANVIHLLPRYQRSFAARLRANRERLDGRTSRLEQELLDSPGFTKMKNIYDEALYEAEETLDMLPNVVRTSFKMPCSYLSLRKFWKQVLINCIRGNIVAIRCNKP